MAKVCVVSPWLYQYTSETFEGGAGGAERQQSMILSELIEEGYEVSVIVADFDQKPREVYSGLVLIKGLPKDMSGLLGGMRFLRSLSGTLFSVNAEIHHVRGAPRLATATFLCSKVLRRQFVFRVANDADVDPSYLLRRYSKPFVLLYRSVLSAADAVIAQTEHQQHLLKKHFGVEAYLVPNGYDLPDKDQIVTHGGRQHVLWVGSSDPEKKNPFIFVRLAERLPNLQFTMISQPISNKRDFHQHLRAKAASVRNLDFKGPVDPEEIHNYYRQASLLVNTSSYEGFPNTFLEAWRYETPVVSMYFDLDGLLENGIGGVKAGGMERLVNEVESLASNASHRANIGESARVYLIRNYSLSKVVSMYKNVFNNVLKK
ncbi:glycosyltransferase involved in cell wall biosynthesis [Salinibacter ruber]|uniref:Glycosyltransferase involved in cell wall biosynthesis n=1 Tax=Salinibacter ruber TaxID=146919 RepID=A0A9X2Q1J7_9BACT|nr:glycosyltransferase family 4 protein [Salinibacter ruber]MCS3677801.1 glycosyltransferase involved in cell wall biosynthesis [Salinibacter ruber]MCS3681089.1 glycosyltransferase involved in cell wall biosynthesis [Salinibacter ruber]